MQHKKVCKIKNRTQDMKQEMENECENAKWVVICGRIFIRKLVILVFRMGVRAVSMLDDQRIRAMT